MILGIVGSRTFTDYELFSNTLKRYKITKLVSGGARGADKFAEVYGLENNIPVETYLPNWQLHGKAAGMIRNKDIIDNSEQVIAFWDEKSRGTANSIQLSTEQGKLLDTITGWSTDKDYDWSIQNPLLTPLYKSKIPPLVISA